MLRRHLLVGAPLLAAPAWSKRLGDAVRRIPIISTHEHLHYEDDRLAAGPDPFALVNHYLINDLVSAGLPAEGQRLLEDSKAPLAKRLEAMAPYWPYVRHTGYARAFRIALAEIYGQREWNPAAAEAVRTRMAAWKRGFYRDILVARGGWEAALLDDYWNGEPKRPDAFFGLARKFDWFVTAGSEQALRRMEEVTGVSITSLDGLKRAMVRRIEQNLAVGMIAIKATIAYQRSLEFQQVSEGEASRAFDRIRLAEPATYMERPRRALEDHMFHFLVEQAEARALPLQVHTGIQAGNGNHLPNSRPALLSNLLLRYPRVQFDLFHLGFPYVTESVALCKMFANAHLNLCWCYVLAPATTERVLREALDTVPYNKILGFGGDYQAVELSYAHGQMAREALQRVLGGMVLDRRMSEAEALQVARALLHDNPARLYWKRNV